MIHKSNQGGSLCNLQVNFAELAWTNAFTTDVLHGAAQDLTDIVYSLIHARSLFSLLIHQSPHLVVC